MLHCVHKVPYRSTSFCFLKTQGHIGAIGLGPYNEGVLLLLVAVILDDPRLKQQFIGLIFRLDIYARFILLGGVSVIACGPHFVGYVPFRIH